MQFLSESIVFIDSDVVSLKCFILDLACFNFFI